MLKDEATKLDKKEERSNSNIGTIALPLHMSEAIVVEEAVMVEEVTVDKDVNPAEKAIESPPRIHLGCNLPTR
jgi:hypothetical protein